MFFLKILFYVVWCSQGAIENSSIIDKTVVAACREALTIIFCLVLVSRYAVAEVGAEPGLAGAAGAVAVIGGGVAEPAVLAVPEGAALPSPLKSTGEWCQLPSIICLEIQCLNLSVLYGQLS